MARPEDEDAPWTRQLLVGVGALVAVALVIGIVVGIVALGAAHVSGLSSAKRHEAEAPRLVMPTGNPTTTPETFPDPAKPSGAASPSSSTTSSAPTKKAKSRAISLQVFPAKVSPGERINFTGVYARGEGRRLQVQRFEGGWHDFPVSASVSGGLFSTYIVTSHTGTNRFRVMDTASGKASNAVRVRIG
jgi:hypothetical protein